MSRLLTPRLFSTSKVTSDPESVKPLFATWESYFAAGDTFAAKVLGVGWFDSAAQTDIVLKLDAAGKLTASRG